MRWRKEERGERGREREELIIIVKCKKLSVRPSLKRYKNKSLEKTRRLFGSSREKSRVTDFLSNWTKAEPEMPKDTVD